mmetsp:Transcript_38081/g.108744  ORF Transcript_38081/g.108744 Transcript_38081/m.108744 type:complete len:205 (-) Transcript_38081:104-718(-)
MLESPRAGKFGQRRDNGDVRQGVVWAGKTWQRNTPYCVGEIGPNVTVDERQMANIVKGDGGKHEPAADSVEFDAQVAQSDSERPLDMPADIAHDHLPRLLGVLKRKHLQVLQTAPHGGTPEHSSDDLLNDTTGSLAIGITQTKLHGQSLDVRQLGDDLSHLVRVKVEQHAACELEGGPPTAPEGAIPLTADSEKRQLLREDEEG